MREEEIQEQMFRAMFRLKRFNVEVLLPDVSCGELKVLKALRHHLDSGNSDEGVYVSRIAEEIHAVVPAVSRLLKGMESKGYIVRYADTNDRRSIRVQLTDCGVQKEQECVRILKNYSARVIRRMGDEQMFEFLNLFNRMVDVMQEELNETEKGDGICSKFSDI